MSAAGSVETTVSAPPRATSADEDVRCPLCDYNLRGLVEPKCPECGYCFTWPEVLDPALRRHPYLFEHHPRRNLWSFWRTVCGGLRPRRFWSALYPSQPSHRGRLVLYWLVTSSLTIFAAATPLTIETVDIMRGQRRARAAVVAQLTSPAFNRNPLNAQLVARLTQQYGSVQNYANAVYRTDWRYAAALAWRRAGPIAYPFAAMAAWPWLTLLALMVFRISMRRARIRPVHVMRCTLYAFDGVFWLGLVSLLLAPAAAGVMMLPYPAPAEWVAPAVGLIYLAGFLFMIYRLTVAYRLYLRFDHPVATVLASQVIVFLFVLTALVNLTMGR